MIDGGTRRILVALVLASCYHPDTVAVDGDGGGVPGDTLPAIAGCLADLAAGDEHTCALRRDGQVYCWGSNMNRQLAERADDTCRSGGECTATPRATDLAPARAIGLGQRSTCVLGDDGTVTCRGSLTNAVRAEVAAPTGSEMHALDVGVDFACGQDTTHALACVGANTYGQLGIDPITLPTSNDLRANGAGNATHVVAGRDFACLLDVAGQVRCWGENGFRQLGRTTTRLCGEPPLDCDWDPLPVPLNGLAIDLATFDTHVCALLGDGTVWCWGRNTSGQLGYGATATYRVDPAQVEGLRSQVTAIATGNGFSCALLDTRDVDCWGDNMDGQFGNNMSTIFLSGTASGFTDVARLAAGLAHACVLTREGRVLCAGSNASGQLGTGAADPDTRIPRETTVPCP